MELNSQEQAAKEYIEYKFVPVLHEFLKSRNPKEYRRWGGNACKQTAIFGSLFLNELLPNYKWSVWEGLFKDIVKGREVTYNHAWIYGVDRQAGRRLLVDASRNHHERLFIVVGGNKYPKDHPSYLYMEEIERHKLDIQEALKDKEYYTFLDTLDFLSQIRVMISNLGGE